MFRRLAIGLIALAALQLPGMGPSQAAWEFQEDDMSDCPGHWCRAANFLACNTTHYGCVPARDESGLIRFDYWVNAELADLPRPLSLLTRRTSSYDPSDPAHFRQAVAYAARTWEYALPEVRFRFMGFTDVPPGVDDGINVIALWPSEGLGKTWRYLGRDARFDVAVEPSDWEWYPCRFDCHPMPTEDALDTGPVNGESWLLELGELLVHELGHVLGLDHPSDAPECPSLSERWSCSVAPRPEGQEYSRHRQSPAYGELLALRWLYGYKCPPKPAGYVEADPNGPFTPEIAKKRSWVPWRYRQVCPTIRIGYP